MGLFDKLKGKQGDEDDAIALGVATGTPAEYGPLTETEMPTATLSQPQRPTPCGSSTKPIR